MNSILPSPPATTSVLPSLLNVRPFTPGFGFGGSGGGVRQSDSVCARADVTLNKTSAARQKLDTVILMNALDSGQRDKVPSAYLRSTSTTCKLESDDEQP